MDGCVYVLEWSSGWSTVGASAWPEKRISELRLANAKVGIVMLRRWTSKPMPHFKEILHETERLVSRSLHGKGAFAELVFLVSPWAEMTQKADSQKF